MLPLGPRQDADELRDLGGDLGLDGPRELAAARRDANVGATAVVRRGDPLYEAAPLRTIDQTAQARFLEPEVSRELQHGWFTVAQDAEQPHLDERQVMCRCYPRECGLQPERQLKKAVNQTWVLRFCGHVPFRLR